MGVSLYTYTSFAGFGLSRAIKAFFFLIAPTVCNDDDRVSQSAGQLSKWVT